MVLKGLLEHYRNRRRHDRLYRPPPQQGWRGFINRKLYPQETSFVPEKRMNLLLNRYCNLNCYSCACMGMNPPKDETTIEELQAFLVNIKGYRQDPTFLLTGGEPTAIDHGKLEKICDLIHGMGYKTALLTNGYKLIPTKWIDYIVLDKHGINDEDIAKWETHLAQEDRDSYEFREKQWHMDIPYAMKDNISKGVRCGTWMSITLWKDVVYPCCNIMAVAWWNGDMDQKLASSLKDAGWNAYNPDLVETIKNWRDTLPGEVYRSCMTQCWKDSSKTKWVKIT